MAGSSDLTIILTEKGKPQLIYYGHSYRINRRNESIDKIYWRCVRKECKANVRARNSFPYQNPLNCREFLLPDEFKITHRNERFLLSDTYQVDRGGIIIFRTDRGKQLMSRSNRVFFDGTFKTVPEIFYQLFTIHCDISGNVLPCAFVLMEKNYL
ncbi:hypothetical protein RF11_15729 [Thelohanellus kitauei]|uniref:FLYWCH-type domain-containing protein n=1 Tax=Thelohanellus kitauei TaxID=669202 RepID=A0A0C2N0Q4_THEKT|nr:hypothetical protein RF11_15729 [Thelohanellus kitauei]